MRQPERGYDADEFGYGEGFAGCAGGGDDRGECCLMSKGGRGLSWDLSPSLTGITTTFAFCSLNNILKFRYPVNGKCVQGSLERKRA